MVSTIGIKIANGEFYSITEENSPVRKRLILTTVHDGQPSVQIDLYRSATQSMMDAQYIGSLVVENIKPKPKGEPSIEMVISSSENGDIVADAIDLDTSSDGEHYVLSVSLKSLDEASRDADFPDFELEANEEPPVGLLNKAEAINRKRPVSWLALVIIGIILLLGLSALWFFLFGGKEMLCKSKPAAETFWFEAEPAKTEPEKIEPQKQPDPPPVIKAPEQPPAPRPQQTAARKRPAPPVASYKVPATIPKEGVPYKIRWGDTLWDIADAFYRNPWLYPRIARHNDIRNPNLIISGTTITVPPKN